MTYAYNLVAVAAATLVTQLFPRQHTTQCKQPPHGTATGAQTPFNILRDPAANAAAAAASAYICTANMNDVYTYGGSWQEGKIRELCMFSKPSYHSPRQQAKQLLSP
jgi:hypothetical protein